MKLNIKFIYPYILSIFLSLVILIYFTYKGVIAYLIHKELYGSGMDVLVSLRIALAGIMLLLLLLLFQFARIKEFKSQKTIITGIFIGWSSLLIILLLINRELIYFIISCGLASFVNLLSLFTLVDLIKEERNTLTDKEIYLLQKLAKKK